MTEHSPTSDQHKDKYEVRLEKLEQQNEQLTQSNQQILNIVTELKLGLVGSKQLEIEGVVQKVKRHDEYIEKDKKQKYKFAGAAGILVFLLTFLKDWIINLFKT